ncbi:MAG TPA: mercury(II) reductase [Caldilineae bacterium]|nr:mercury(II) reductase [Caldilineae bacterium]
MSERRRITLRIEGMTCDSCAEHVARTLRAVSGVLQADVPGWQSARAEVMADEEVDDAALVRAVEAAGYRATIQARQAMSGARFRPRSDVHYDLIVIGGGSAGFAAAIRGAELGARVGLINDGAIGLGGTCVNIGCIPSKTLIRTAEAWHKAGHHPFTGVHTRQVNLNWACIVGQKDELVSELRQAKYADVLTAYPQITLIEGRARLNGDGTVAVGDRVYRADKYVIATGAHPRLPDLPGVEEVGVLTSTTAMALPEQPRSLVILGGRFVALELGQAFARFGTAVTILQRSPRIIPQREPEISEALRGYLEEEGLTILTGVKLLALRAEGEEKIVVAEVNGKRREFRAQQVLAALGHVPNTEGLGLEEAGIALGPDGHVKVNATMQTSNPDVYAAGDVTGLADYVYVAAAGGIIAAENALTGSERRLDLSTLPEVMFTDPQVAVVGLTEQQAREQGYDVKTSVLALEHVPRALAARDTRGLIKLVADRTTDRLLGAHVLAVEAGEVIQTAVLALKAGYTTRDLATMMFPYLTMVEGLKLAAQAFEKDVAKLSCCAG